MEDSTVVNTIGRSSHQSTLSALYQPSVPLAQSPPRKPFPVMGKEDTSMYDASKFQMLTLAEAEPVFLAYKRTRVKPETMVCYEMYFRHLRVHFAEKHLYDISITDIQEYQALRLRAMIKPPPVPGHTKSKRGRQPTYRAGASLINHEINALAQMLKKADQWDRIAEWYSPVEQQTPTPPKTMTRAAEEEFFRKAALNPDWAVAYHVAALTNNTSASGIEIRSLRLMDIDLQGSPPKFQVLIGKNRFREHRVIPLNEEAYVHMCAIVERAVLLGARHPEHCVFPFRVKRGEYDVTRHASRSWLKKQWRALTVAAGVSWLKPHNLRFQCATKMKAAGVPDEIIVKVFGWKNVKMLTLYDEPQIDILHEYVQRIDPGAKKPPQNYDFTPQWMPKTGFAQKKRGA